MKPLSPRRLLTASLLGVGLGCSPARPQSTVPATPSLADALAALHARPKVDLTHSFSATTPVAPGFGQARLTPAVDPRTLEAYTIAHDGFRATYYAMAGAYGTHVEAPAAVAPDGRSLDEIDPGNMILPLVVLDDTPFLAADPAHAFSPDDLAAWERTHGRVPAGSFVALRTDLSKDWASPSRFERSPFPAWSLAVLKLLFEARGVTAIGHESLETTVGREGAAYVLGQGHWQAAGLANLGDVPATGAVIVAAWPKPKSGFAFPARVFAVLP